MKFPVCTLLAFLFFCSTLTLMAQPSHIPDTSDTVYDAESYAFRPIANRNYDYASMIQKERLTTLSDDIMNLGFLTMIVTAGVGAALLDYDKLQESSKQLWVYVPCATIVLMGECLGFIYLSRHVKQKADNIQVASIYEYDLNDTYAFSVCNHHDRISGTDSPGIGLKIRF